MSRELVRVKVDNYIADVQLNRPKKSNALSFEMFDAIAAVIDRLSDEKDLRAVVLSGAGRHFCAGADIEVIKTRADSDAKPASLMARYRGSSNLFQYVANGWRNLSVPVIAAVQGVAYGGGFQIALGADIRYASMDAKLSAMEIKWGLIPDMGISQSLRGVVNQDVARELLYTGRVVTAEEAVRIGLLTRIVEDPYREAMNVAADIALKNPQAISAVKQLIDRSWYSEYPEFGLMLESELQEKLSASPNQKEAIQAQIEGRVPEFSNN